jgi:hypothetical protein
MRCAVLDAGRRCRFDGAGHGGIANTPFQQSRQRRVQILEVLFEGRRQRVEPLRGIEEVLKRLREGNVFDAKRQQGTLPRVAASISLLTWGEALAFDENTTTITRLSWIASMMASP